MSAAKDETSVPLREGSTALRRKVSAPWVSVDIPESESPPRWRGVLFHFREFCEKTSLHGLQYLGEPRRPMRERICWLLAVIISITCCSLVIRKQWIKWKTSPVIVTFAETSTPVWEIPFPAVTICPEVKFLQSDFNYTDLITKENQTDEELRQLEYGSVVCYLHVFDGGNLTIDDGVFAFLLGITPPVDAILQYCEWRSKRFRCSELFSPVVTDDGVCYAFNTLAARDLFNDDVVLPHLTDNTRPRSVRHWSLETLYDTVEEDNDTYPWRTMSAGTMAGMTVFLEAQDLDVDGKCRAPIEGFKLVLHSPAVFPEVSENFIRLPSNRDVIIGVNPKIVTTNEELRDYSPRARKCFFQNEKHLRFFRNYTQENCENECYVNFTVSQCGCSEYYMPRDNSTPICGPGLNKCTYEIMDKYNFDSLVHETCNCLATCTEVKYDVETSQAGYKWEKYDGSLKNKSYGTFSIFLRDMQVITMKRSELFGATDFLANCGGLLGLFLGFSILSVVEIVYHVTLRVFGYRRDKRSD